MNHIMEAVAIGAIIAGIPLTALIACLVASKMPKIAEKIKTKRKWRKIAPVLKEIYMDKEMTTIVVKKYFYSQPRVINLNVNPYDPDSIKRAEETVKFHVENNGAYPPANAPEPEIYGATWTDKGLIYVAKYVNGEWEVIGE